MPNNYILNEAGDPVIEPDLLKWAEWYENSGLERQLARTTIRANPEVVVSTVFLGVDHNYMGGPPAIYETMVFGGPFDGHMCRYAYKEMAQWGHDKMVEDMRVIIETGEHKDGAKDN